MPLPLTCSEQNSLASDHAVSVRTSPFALSRKDERFVRGACPRIRSYLCTPALPDVIIGAQALQGRALEMGTDGKFPFLELRIITSPTSYFRQVSENVGLSPSPSPHTDS